jgi:hypothetical protein
MVALLTLSNQYQKAYMAMAPQHTYKLTSANTIYDVEGPKLTPAYFEKADRLAANSQAIHKAWRS